MLYQSQIISSLILSTMASTAVASPKNPCEDEAPVDVQFKHAADSDYLVMSMIPTKGTEKRPDVEDDTGYVGAHVALAALAKPSPKMDKATLDFLRERLGALKSTVQRVPSLTPEDKKRLLDTIEKTSGLTVKTGAQPAEFASASEDLNAAMFPLGAVTGRMRETSGEWSREVKLQGRIPESGSANALGRIQCPIKLGTLNPKVSPGDSQGTKAEAHAPASGQK